MNKNVTSNVTVVQMKKYGTNKILFRLFSKNILLQMHPLLPSKISHYFQSFDFSLLTSEHRKDVFHQMIKKYVKSIENETDIIIDPFFILLGLLLGDGNS